MDFYADWCGPCRQLAPELEKLAKNNPDIDLVKIDIERWGSDVAKQFNIRSIPYIRIYDGKGKLMGDTRADLRRLMQERNS